MKNLITFFLIAWSFCTIQAQSPCDTTTGFPLPALQITDIKGNCYDPATISLPDFPQSIPTGTAGRFIELNTGIYRAGIFILYFDDILDTLDGDNFNFYSNNSNSDGIALGLARIELVCRVYEDLSYLLKVNPWSLPNNKCVRIKVKESTNGMMSSTRAEASTFFVEMNIPQFAHGMVAKTIISGQDAWLNLNNYNPLWVNMPHGTLQVNFGSGIDYDIWANPTLAAGKTNKLYSVILHEATHSLGFSSAIDANGWSRLANNGTPLVFNRFDRFLTKNGLPFPPRTTDANGNVTSISAANLAGITCDSILFQGTNNSNQNIYTGSNFVLGTSLSHFGCTLSGTNYVMQGGTGITSFNMKFDTNEVKTLCDLGYSTTTTFGQDTITNDSTGNTLASYPSCNSCVVIGNHDILNTSGQPFEICRVDGALPCGTPNVLSIPISHLLSNDLAYGSVATGINTFGILAGGGTLVMNGTSTTLIYTAAPNFGGWAILYYTPTNGTCSGNPAYILVYVYPPNNVCAPNAQSSCNLICNGDFESYTNQIPQPQTGVYQIGNFAHNYYNAPNGSTPDFYFNPVPNSPAHNTIKTTPTNICYSGFLGPLTVNNQSTFMALLQPASPSSCRTGEAFHFPLHSQLQTGKSYVIKMLIANKCSPTEVFAVLCQNPPITGNIIINDLRTYFPPSYSLNQSYNHNNLTCSYSPVPPAPINSGTFNATVSARETIRITMPRTSFFTSVASNLVWTTIQDTFSVGSNGLDNLIIHIAPNNPGYYFFDDIEIYEIGTNQYNISVPDTVVACANGNTLIPCIVSAELTNASSVIINLSASLPALLGFGFSGIGDFSNTGQLNTPLLLAPGQTDTVYLNLLVSNNSGIITIAASSPDTSSCLGANSPTATSTYINVINTSANSPLLDIDINAVSTTVAYGATAVYNVTITNQGTDDVNNVLLGDLGSVGLPFSFPNLIPFIAAGSSVTFTVSALNTNCNATNLSLCLQILNASVSACDFNISGINDCDNTVTSSQSLLPVLLVTTNIFTGCFGINNGNVIVGNVNGTPPYTYLWNNSTNSSSITGLLSGTYIVTVTDSRGCWGVDTAVLVQPPLLSLSGALADIACNGSNTGSINITTIGGVMPYAYNWSNGSTTEDLTNLLAGNYIITVTDANSCVISQSYDITQPSALTVNSIVNGIACNGANTGSINITANGGITPYTYNWSNGSFSEDLNSLTAGTYTVTVTDANNCTISQAHTITQPAILAATIAQTSPPCGATAIATLTAFGGISPYTYLWSNGQTTTTAIGLSAGNYTATTTDANGCQSIANIAIVLNPLPIVNITGNTTICNGQSTTITASGASSYIWNTTPVQTTANITVSPITTTSYTVTGTDNNGCTATASTIVTVTSTPSITVTQIVTNSNSNSVTISQTVTATGTGTTNYTLTNIPPIGWTASVISTNNSITAGSSNMHTVVLTLQSTNPNFCTLGVQHLVTITPTSACATAPVQQSIIINTNIMGAGMPTIIPANIPTFTQAIGLPNPLLAPYNTTITQNVVFQGNITHDQSVYTFGNGSQLRMCPAVQITVSTKANMTLDNTYAHSATNQMWRGIKVQNGASFKTTGNNTAMRIEDALYAVEVQHKSLVTIGSTTFDRNYVGIYTAPSVTTNTSNILITNTVFNCSTNLLSAPWASLAIDNWAFAGIEVNDLAALVITNTTGSFSNLTNGVVARRGKVVIHKISFNNIQPRSFYSNQGLPSGNGIYLDGFVNNVSGIHSLEYGGFTIGTSAPNSFTDCSIGIQSVGAHLLVGDAKMAGITRWGVYCSEAKRCKITIQNNSIELRNNTKASAIVLNHNDDPLSSGFIWGNVLKVAEPILLSGIPVLNQAYGGVVLNEGGNGYGLTIAQNNINLHRATYGIYINGNKGAKIYNNTLNFQRSFLGLGLDFDRFGIYTENCTVLSLKCNTITSTLQGNNVLAQTWGIDIHKSQVVAECNLMERTATGMRFDGNCNGSEVKANSFKRNHIGLHYLAGAIVSSSPQIDKGNLWYGNFTISGAVHGGAVIPNNRYNVSPLTPPLPGNPSYTPPNVTPGWFLFTGSPSTTANCNNAGCSSPAPALLAALNPVDVAVVNNQIPQNPLALPWGLRKGLYDKLDKNPILQQNPVMGQFYNSHQNQPISAVVATQDALLSVSMVDTPNTILTTQYNSYNNALTDSLLYIDSLYIIGALNAIDWENQRNTLLEQLIPNNNPIYGLSNTLHQERNNRGQQAQMTNNTITASNSPETNEKAVNDIYLQTVAIGNRNFTIAQKQILYDIAHQCPDVDGNAVYKARSIYALIEQKNYNDNCSPLPQNRVDNLDTCYESVVFPNPSLEGDLFSTPWNAAPYQWSICEISPDIQPQDTFFIPASDSLTYSGFEMALAVQAESIGCLLPDTLVKGEQYKFLFDFVSSKYPFPQNGSISMWIGSSLCSKDQLIYAVATTDSVWRTYEVEFVPNEHYPYFIISAEPNPPHNLSYGMVDNLRPVPCDTITAPPVDTNEIISILPEKETLLGVEEITINNFNIYPNPNSYGQLMVEWGVVLPFGEIVLVDALGRNVAHYTTEQQSTQQQINIEHLPSGFYTVLLQNESRIMARAKLIVAKH